MCKIKEQLSSRTIEQLNEEVLGNPISTVQMFGCSIIRLFNLITSLTKYRVLLASLIPFRC